MKAEISKLKNESQFAIDRFENLKEKHDHLKTEYEGKETK